MGHADEMLENAPKLKKKIKQDKQYDEVQKRIDNIAFTVVELIGTVEAMKTVMDNRKSTCNCSKSVDKDDDSTQKSSGNCKIESRRDELNKELYSKFKKTCMGCKYNTCIVTFNMCVFCNNCERWEDKYENQN